MKTIKGDLVARALNGEYDVIIHGCNCFNTMGSGIAPKIVKAFPSVRIIDNLTIKGDPNKLGTISFAYDSERDLFIVNAYTQYSMGNGFDVDYDALGQCFKQVKTMFYDKKIAYPAIGCGLAGGNWNIVSNIINTILEDVDHTFIEWDQT